MNKIFRPVAELLDFHNYRIRVGASGHGVLISIPPNRFLRPDERRRVVVLEFRRDDDSGIVVIEGEGEDRFIPLRPFAFRVVVACLLAWFQEDLGLPERYNAYETADGGPGDSLTDLMPLDDPAEAEAEETLMKLVFGAMDAQFSPFFDVQAETLDMVREFEVCKALALGGL